MSLLEYHKSIWKRAQKKNKCHVINFGMDSETKQKIPLFHESNRKNVWIHVFLLFRKKNTNIISMETMRIRLYLPVFLCVILGIESQ